VFIDEKTFLQKNMEQYDETFVKHSFGNTKLQFCNKPDFLERLLINNNYSGKNLLFMSSGNFGGLNLIKYKDIALLNHNN
ncbi:MAG: peptidoglycan synthetase, partial [Daejeonella sp.]